MKKALAIFAAASIALSASAVAFARPTAKPTCPIQKEKVDKLDPKLMSTYKGKNYYFCCASCKPAFDKMSDTDKVALLKYGVDIKKPAAKKPATIVTKSAKKPA